MEWADAVGRTVGHLIVGGEYWEGIGAEMGAFD